MNITVGYHQMNRKVDTGKTLKRWPVFVDHYIFGFTNEGTLFGYALIFAHPSQDLPLYCHKIYVYEQYRGHKIGSKLLAAILDFPNEVGLLCSSDLVPFYESAGMYFKGNFTPPLSDAGVHKNSRYVCRTLRNEH
ncbi:GNAT family N-acetyltransferase [Pantoea sp. FN0302]|uniref:GNAT family N-acetyltransferase n=1 Tax=Pantoea sp. FN0302 TaxID=3418558 RepID=UPI003CE8EF84